MEHGDHVISVLRHTLSLLQHPMDELLVRVPMVLHNDVVHLEYVVVPMVRVIHPHHLVDSVLLVLQQQLQGVVHGTGIVIVPMVEPMRVVVLI